MHTVKWIKEHGIQLAEVTTMRRLPKRTLAVLFVRNSVHYRSTHSHLASGVQFPMQNTQRIRRMMRNATIAMFALVSTLFSLSVAGQEPAPSEAQEEPIDTSNMEEVVVSGVRDKILNPVTIESFHHVFDLGEHFYRNRQYTRAFPYLLASAKSGFKMSQARVSHIYRLGLGDIPRNGEAAIGWLGVAATHPTDPAILNEYKKMMKQIPKNLEPRVEEIIAEYRYKYGPDATGNKCLLIRSAGSHVARLKCNFQEEFELRDGLFEELLSGLMGLDVDPNLSETEYRPVDQNRRSVSGTYQFKKVA